MTTKSIKVEKNEDFIHAWEEETCLWDVFSLFYKDRNAKAKIIIIIMFALLSTLYFLKCPYEYSSLRKDVNSFLFCIRT